MNPVAIKPNDLRETVSPGIVRIMTRGVRRIIANWIESQSILKHQWELYCTTAQHHVPYRVWLRHGAYLEMKYQSRSDSMPFCRVDKRSASTGVIGGCAALIRPTS